MTEEVKEIIDEFKKVINPCVKKKAETYDKLDKLHKQDLIYYIIEQAEKKQ